MGKRASAVAVLLATSFLGSLMALVLVGRNPLVRPSSDVARTESLRRGFEGSPVTVPALASPGATSSVTEAVEEAVLSSTDVRPAEASYRPGSEAAAEEVTDAVPTPTPEAEPATEGEDVVAKAADEQAVTNAAGSNDQVKEPKASKESKGSKEPKRAKGQDADRGQGDDVAGGAGAKGSGKGPKHDKATGLGSAAKETPGRAASESSGKAKGKTKT